VSRPGGPSPRAADLPGGPNWPLVVVAGAMLVVSLTGLSVIAGLTEVQLRDVAPGVLVVVGLVMALGGQIGLIRRRRRERQQCPPDDPEGPTR